MSNSYQRELSKRAHESEVSLVDQTLVKQVLVLIQDIAGSAKNKDIEQIYPHPVSGREMTAIRSILVKNYGNFSRRVSLTSIDGKQGQETLIKITKKGK
jgi:hypothetical protein